MTAIRIARTIVNQLLHQAQSSPGAEVCGLIGAKDGVPVRCYAVPNAAAHPQARYCMDPAAQIAAMRRMRETEETLFAIYHSHPHGAAYPSPIDIAEAAYPDCIYLIVSLDTKGVLEMRGFRIREGAVTECELILES